MDMNYRGGMWEGGGGQDGVGGEKWDNCNSIINKYIKKIIADFLNEKGFSLVVIMETVHIQI